MVIKIKENVERVYGNINSILIEQLIDSIYQIALYFVSRYMYNLVE